MMTHWKRLTCLGNQYQEQGDIRRARTLYRAALAEAERWLELMLERQGFDEQDADTALGAYVISQRNLADLACCRDHPDAAACHLASACERLAMIQADATLPRCLRMAAIRHGRRSRAMLLRHCRALDDARETVHEVRLPRPGSFMPPVAERAVMH